MMIWYLINRCKLDWIGNNSITISEHFKRKYWIEVALVLSSVIYEGRTESHEQSFFACKPGTADEREYGGRWNQLLCYPWVSCDVNSLHHVTSITPNKMVYNNMSFRQRAVIEFLVKEEIPAAEIHQRLQHAYGSVCMGAGSVRRWVKPFKDGNTSIQDQPRSGRPRTTSTERNKERVDTIARTLGLGHSAVQEMIESLGYRKICVRISTSIGSCMYLNNTIYCWSKDGRLTAETCSQI